MAVMMSDTMSLDMLLNDMNPWWFTGNIPKELAGILRDRYLEKLKGTLDIPEITIITGMRRTGKTTMMYQLMDELLRRGTDPRNLLYIQFDHPMLRTCDPGELLRGHRTNKGIPKSEMLYLFLDETHFLGDWAQWVKMIHDQRMAKIFLSGSSKVLLLPGAMTHLTGRYLSYGIWPLTFPEFLKFRNAVPGPGDHHMYVSLAEDYLSVGGFPRVVLERDGQLRRKILLEYFDSILFADIAAVHEIRDLRSLRELAAFLVTSSGKPVSLSKMKKTFKLSLDTIREYISYIEESHIIDEIPVASPSRNERIYNPRKYYVLDTGMRTALTGEKEMGTRAETALHLLFSQCGHEVGYWKQIHEIDFILQGNESTAVESKYKDVLAPKDILPMKKWLHAEKNGRGYIVTRNLEDDIELDGMHVKAVPLWKMLLDPEMIGDHP